MRRLLLLRHAPTSATREGMFPADEPLDDDARAEAAAARALIGSFDRVLCSPMVRTRQTAEALGLFPTIDAGLSECDFGSWAGLSIDEVRTRHADTIDAWLADPASAPHGGETLEDVAVRVRAFLQLASTLEGTTLAVTHGGIIRVAIVIAREQPLATVWTVNVEPLSVTELSFYDGRWHAPDA
ncbi:MAG: histidine phosphatase family protein [Actinomycetota bacterium]